VGGMRLTIAIERDKAWEEPGKYILSSAGVDDIGGTWVIGSDIGSMGQRIAKFKMEPTGFSQAKYWAGIRDIRNGTTGFISKWEAEDGSLGTDASLAADATASPGAGNSKVNIDFTTFATMRNRLSIRWSQIQTVGNWDDIIGSYLLLGRLKLDADTTEIAIQIQHGWTQLGGTGTIVGTTFLSGVDDSSLVNWNFIELGSINIPPTGNRENTITSSDDIKNYVIQLWSERISGSGELDIDCFVLIPNEHLFVAKSPVDINNSVDAFTGPDGYQYALGKDGTTYGNLDFHFTDWFYSIGGGIMVIAVQQTTRSVNLTDTADLTIELYPRWKTFRETVAT